MKLEINNEICLYDFQTPLLKNVIKSNLTMDNPKFSDAEYMNRSTKEIDPYLECFYEEDDALYIPRGYGNTLCQFAAYHKEPVDFIDYRQVLPEVEFAFTGTLRPYQKTAIDDCIKEDWGVLQAPTGSGKTAMAIAIIAERKQPALIICHTKELLNQWIERIETFLGIPKEEIGIIGGGNKKIGNKITVSLVQSLYKCAEDIAPHIGFLIVDECHRCPSRTFTEAVMAFDCKFMLGLSATPYRRDGLTDMIHWYLGDTLHTVNADELVEDGHLCRAEVHYRRTNFYTETDASQYYSRALSEMT
jgi:superfamily II DNA or RNA helicase